MWVRAPPSRSKNRSKRYNMKCEKIKFKSGINYCLWKPHCDKDGNITDDETGDCIDLSEDDVKKTIAILKEYQKKEPDIHIPDPETIRQDEQIKAKQSTWYYKFWDTYLRNISITINFFEWSNPFGQRLFTTRQMLVGKQDYANLWCVGISFGPIIITWK